MNKNEKPTRGYKPPMKFKHRQCAKPAPACISEAIPGVKIRNKFIKKTKLNNK